MVIKIKNPKELPFHTRYDGYILETEDDTKFIGDRTAYMFISKSPKCIFLFVEAKVVTELDN